MNHPFFEFVQLIGNDDSALQRFLDDPNDPNNTKAAQLTEKQRAALLSGSFDAVAELLIAENPNVKAESEAQAAASATPQMIGWNMALLMGQIRQGKARP